MSGNKKRPQATGSLDVFLLPRAELATALNGGALASSAPASLALPVLSSGKSSPLRLKPPPFQSISSSVLLESDKSKSLSKLLTRGESERYFLTNVISPSDSQRVIQLLSAEDTSIQQNHRHSHHQRVSSTSEAAASRDGPRRASPSRQNDSSSGGMQQQRRARNNMTIAGGRERTADADVKHLDKIHKYTKYASLYRELGSEISTGMDDDGSDFIRFSSRQSNRVLDDLKSNLREAQASRSPTPGHKEAIVRKLRSDVSKREGLVQRFEQAVRVSTAEARGRNKEFIDRTRRSNEQDAQVYGPSELRDADDLEDNAFLSRCKLARTASAAFLRQGHRLQLIPFGIQEFLDALATDMDRDDGLTLSTDLLVSFTGSAAAAATTTATTATVGNNATISSATGGSQSLIAGGDDDDPEECTSLLLAPPISAEGSVVSIDSSDGNIVSINTGKWGLGDDKALCLAAALTSCPALKSLDVSGNRLTDRSCAPILRALLQLSTLKYLNLSDNKLDDRSIEPLRQNLSSESCSIVHLHLAKSDVDDDECARFMVAMRSNRSVRVMNLSQNKIGEMEERTIVFPGFITGGMAIAGVFADNTTLEELDLSWNCLRHNTAITFSKSLAFNNTLRFLNLAKNNIGDVAAQHLGHALRSNTTMTKLDVSYNNILPKGTMVLANALESHGRMREVALHGNCVGELGSKALLRAMRLAASHSRKLVVAFRDSNVYFQDRALFNRQEPRQGAYQLKCDDPYDFFVATVLYEAYNGKQGALFRDLRYRAPGAKVWDKIPLKRPDRTGSSNSAWSPHLRAATALIDTKIIPLLPKAAAGDDSAAEALVGHRAELLKVVVAIGLQLGLSLPEDVAKNISALMEALAPEQRGQIHQLFRIIFRTVFRIVDTDQGGSVDRTELAKCLALLGVSFAARPELCLDYARRMIAGVDVDGSGTLDEGEFVRMLFVTYTETYPEPPLPLVDSRTNEKWTIPTEGELAIDFVSEKLPPSLDELQSDEAVKSFSGSLEGSVDPGLGKEAAIKDSVSGDMFLTCEQAEVLLSYFSNPLVDNRIARRNAVEHFTPQMTTAVEACRFLAQNMSIKEIFKLRRKWGVYLTAITGLACGHFYFNLNSEMDRKAAKRLAQLNSLFTSKTKIEGPTRDTSQNGDFEGFRNAQLNGKGLLLTSTFFSELPVLPVAKLAFDFVNTSRPVPGIEACSDEAIDSLMETMFSSDLGNEDNDNEKEKEKEGEREKGRADGEGDGEEGEEEEEEEGEKGVAARANQQGTAEGGGEAGVEVTDPDPALDEHDYDSEDEEYLKRKADKEAREEQRRKEEQEKKEHDLKHKKRPGAGLLAGIKRQEELTRAAKARHEARLNKKTESLAAIAERALNEQYHAQWESYLESTKAVYKMANAARAKEVLVAALIEEGSPIDSKDLKPTASALASPVYTALRKSAPCGVDLGPFLDAWRKKERRETRKTMAKETLGLGLGLSAAPAAAGPAAGLQRSTLRRTKVSSSLQAMTMLSYAERELLLQRCISFEKSLQMLECYLIYNLWVSCEQVRHVCEAYFERGAPEPVVVRCISVMFCRIVDLENLLPHLLDHASLGAHPFIKEDVLHRLGVLNVLSPLHTDDSWTLDLASFDEREAAKLFVRLASIEGGPGAVHFVNTKYARSLFEPHAGKEDFKVPVSWRDAPEPGGVPKFGQFSFFYKSSEDSVPFVFEKESKKKVHKKSKHNKKGKDRRGHKTVTIASGGGEGNGGGTGTGTGTDTGTGTGTGTGASDSDTGSRPVSPSVTAATRGGSRSRQSGDRKGEPHEGQEEEADSEGGGEGGDDGEGGEGEGEGEREGGAAEEFGAMSLLDENPSTETEAEAEAPPQVYCINTQARHELQAFRCLAGTHGTFVKGVSVDSSLINSNSLSQSKSTVDTDAVVSEADWSYVQGILEDQGVGMVLDAVGFTNVYFGPVWKAAQGKDKFVQ